MALKPDRKINDTNVALVCGVVANEGEIAVYTTPHQSGGMGTSNGTCTIAANPSGYHVAGVMLANFVSIDSTKYHKNFHNNELLLNEKAPLATDGWVLTNKYVGSPTVGATAYLSSSGSVTPTVHATGGTAATPKVGRFESIPDEDAYVKLSFKIPTV